MLKGGQYILELITKGGCVYYLVIGPQGQILDIDAGAFRGRITEALAERWGFENRDVLVSLKPDINGRWVRQCSLPLKEKSQLQAVWRGWRLKAERVGILSGKLGVFTNHQTGQDGECMVVLQEADLIKLNVLGRQLGFGRKGQPWNTEASMPRGMAALTGSLVVHSELEDNQA